jgi:hypothetical protein
MTKNVKIALVSFGIVGLGVGAYFLVQYMKLKKAYSTTLSPNDAATLIEQKTQLVPDAIIPDENTANVSQDEDVSNGVVAQQDDSQDSPTSDLNQFNILTGQGDY